jgi:hypothetical protein
LALHHAGFSVPPMLPPERWALTPPFHPYRNALANRRRLAGLPASCHRAAHSGGLSFCGTIRELSSTGFSLCWFWRLVAHRAKVALMDLRDAIAHKLKSALPLPWRYQARCPLTLRPAKRASGFFFLTTRVFRRALLRWCPDFPPAHAGAGL